MGKGKRGSLGDKVLGKRKIDAEETRPDSDSQNIPPEAKREKREDKTLSEEPIPALGERLPRASTGFVRVPHPTDKDKHVLQFPMTESLRDAAGDRKWPAIFFGDDAPLPRWKLVALANPPDADDLEHQLITTYDDKTHIPGVHRGSHPMSYDGKIGLGALDWELEYGPESGFNGFSKEEVYEVAFRCLVDATYDFLCREEIRAWISRQKWFHVANVDDPCHPFVTRLS
ncbi:hypothetical protein N7470_002472 [Penicillium chermesinum]|nr:hypothetical protein N7470_002472 [Penicillium chermesinum]